MTPTEWPVLDRMLWRAREAGFPAGEFVGQESFVSASEVRWLGERAGLGVGVSVLDLCCGVAGPGLMLVREFGCEYLGVDGSARSIGLARGRAADDGVAARFEVSSVPPLPSGVFDIVLLLETMLAFRDKDALLGAVARALGVGGRFAFTVEVGLPLDAAERAAMVDAGTVWLTPFADLATGLERADFVVRTVVDRSTAHRNTVDGLLASYLSMVPELRAAGDARALDVVGDLVSTHRVWSRWLGTGRVRKLAVVAEKVGG